MYITETTKKVRSIFKNLEIQGDISKLKFLLYTFNGLNNNHINSKNIENPDLIEDDDLIIFNLESIGFSSDVCISFLQYNISLYNHLTNEIDLYENNGSVIGLQYTDEEEKIISEFEKLSFNEKLDIFSELIIRYDNETFFEKIMPLEIFNFNISGFDIAYLIQGKKV